MQLPHSAALLTCLLLQKKAGPQQTPATRRTHAGTSPILSSIGLDTPAFQQHLKQLKLRLHPDRVAAHPEARAANEQSFKVLSQYLEELRGTFRPRS